MQRILENLAFKRKKKEDAFSSKLEEIQKRIKEISEEKDLRLIQESISRLEKLLDAREKTSSKKGKERPRFFRKRSLDAPATADQNAFNGQVLHILQEIQNSFEKNRARVDALFSNISELIRLNAELAEARDREWDALGSNHVSMIFKSMEWRVEKLAAGYEDASLLMKKFLLLKEKLDSLLSALKEKKLPPAEEIKEISQPLEDWRYTGFENRFRGSPDEVKKQQEAYLPYFENTGEGKVLDLGCGRGEFLELLSNKGIEAEGIDINSQMVEICRDKGLNCQRGDLLEKLAGCGDESLEGIFSSQVIEHLSLPYLKRMIELSFIKLAPSRWIVLETVNPVSVFALVHIYQLDLSHEKPIHPEALKFLLESAGFKDIKILYSEPLKEEQLLNLPRADEISSLLNSNIDRLNKLLYSPPNYAAAGIKQ